MLRTDDPKAPAICVMDRQGAKEEGFNTYFPKFKTEITTHISNRPFYGSYDNFLWYVFENVTVPIREKHGFCLEDNGTLKDIVFSKEEAPTIADPTYLARKQEEERKIHIFQKKLT